MRTNSVLVTLSVVLLAGFGLANHPAPADSGSTTSQTSSSAKLAQDAHFLLPSPSSSLAAPSDAPSLSSTSQAAASSAAPSPPRPPVIDDKPLNEDEPQVQATKALGTDQEVLQTLQPSGDLPFQATAARAARSIESAATSKQLVHQSGEGRRAPRVSVTAVGPQSDSVGRRSEPQITDFIGGIVKLLGGGGPPSSVPAVIASMPSPRPIRPQGTRINNRGPPRITEVVLPNSTAAPPFPFEKPGISGMGPPPLPRPQRPQGPPVRRPIFPDGPVDIPPELAPEKPPTEYKEPQETSTATEAPTTASTTPTTTTTTTQGTKPTTEFSKGNGGNKGTSKASTEPFSPSIQPPTSELPFLESSISEVESASPAATPSSPVPIPIRWSPRPGLVLDDPEFKPGGVASGQPPPIITAPVRRPGLGEVFDVTVSAIQGPSGGQGPQIVTRPQQNQDEEVSIDGRKTYINLLPSQTEKPGEAVEASTSAPTTPAQRPAADPILGQGAAVPNGPPVPSGGPPKSPPRRPAPPKRPPVRIDTCIVGDQSTCDAAQNEACRTEAGVSSCHCKPGHSRRKHRDPCRRIISLSLNLRIDRVYEKRMAWSNALKDADSDEFQQLSWEAVRAIDSAMGMTPFSDDFMGARVNGFSAGPPLVANMTLQLAETAESVRPAVRHDVQRHLLGAITRRNNNVGDSAVWVDKATGAVSGVADLDECISTDLNDCHARATCTNVFGTFRCACDAGLRDPWAGNLQRSGRQCETCPADFCNNRGECSFAAAGERVCACTGNFFGAQCEMDGEVLGVAIGAAVAAVLIIGLTLFGLCMWSRKWNREQQKVEMLSTRTGLTSPVFSYMAAAAAASSAASIKSGMPPTTPAAYVSVEDRMRWAHIADVMAQNHYGVRPEPNVCPTRPSSAVFYPSLPVLYQTARPPPPPTHGPPDSSDEEDHQGLLGRNFQVPRPRSRAASIANQSGIYYDLDYDTRPAPVPAPRSTLPRPPPPIPMAYMQTGQFYRG